MKSQITIDSTCTPIDYIALHITRTEQQTNRAIKRDFLIIAAIYGLPLIYGWGLSVMAGVKFNPHLTLLSIPVFGSLLVAGIIAIYKKSRGGNQCKDE